MTRSEVSVTDAASEVIALARSSGLTVATAESVTGGVVATALTDVPGASDVVCGGIVAYTADVKKTLLGVSEQTLRSAGVVSAEVASQMATGAREACASDLALATTGVAGPDPHGGREAGTVVVACATAGDVRVREFVASGNRHEIRLAATVAALDMCVEVLRERT